MTISSEVILTVGAGVLVQTAFIVLGHLLTVARVDERVASQGADIAEIKKKLGNGDPGVFVRRGECRCETMTDSLVSVQERLHELELRGG